MAGDGLLRRRRLGPPRRAPPAGRSPARAWDQFSGTRDILLAGGAGEQPVVTDAAEPLWQDVEQEAPDELVGGERHGAQPRPAVVAVVLVAEGHAAFVEAEQAAIGDGDTVSVSGEIGEHRLGV